MNDAFQKAKERYKKMSKTTISGFYDEISGRLSDQICNICLERHSDIDKKCIMIA